MATPLPVASPLQARVLGAGPTGALTALALTEAGWRVSLHDPLSAEQLLQRNRAYAFSYSSRRLLERLGLWSEMESELVPFRRLELRDCGAGVGLAFSAADRGRRPAIPASASITPDDAIGWIGQHGPIQHRLLQRLTDDPAVELHLGAGFAAASDPLIVPELVVAADGPDSPTRSRLGLGQWSMAYGQACLTVQVELRGCADDEAWELLRPEGPFAVLPLGEGRFQLVWSAPQARCRQLESLPDVAFLDALAGALPEKLQPDALLDRPRAFPVALQLARRLHRGGTVLVGESGHRCHPVGGQGLNLCWRDVEVLHRLARRVAAGRLEPARLGGAYARRRWIDLMLTLAATDLLVRLFSNRHPLLLPLRRLGVRSLARFGALRRLALGAMSDGPCPAMRRAPE
jgi:2-octaprenyl-6-methoxyphenol hydroxylase